MIVDAHLLRERLHVAEELLQVADVNGGLDRGVAIHGVLSGQGTMAAVTRGC
jgi:hypothetical protein